MKSRLPTLGFVLILSALIISACGPSAVQPTEVPTAAPAETALEAPPTAQPTEAPEATPAQLPTAQPTELPTVQPTHTPPPTARPTEVPTATPTEAATERAEVTGDEISDWNTYTNERYGYALRYPPDCTFGPMPPGCKQKPPQERPPECLCFLNAEDPDRVFLEAFTGEKDSPKGAAFSVTRLAFDPPPGTDLIEYMTEKFPHYEEIPDEPNVEVGGLPAVRLYTPASPMAFSYEEIYFIKDEGLLLIHMHDVDDQANRDLYDRVSSALDISDTETLAPTGGQPVVAWLGRVVSLPTGGQFDDYIVLEPEGAGEVGLTGADNTVEAQIQMLRDSTTYAHFWGTLTCPVLDYGGCQLVVTRLREDRPGPAFAPDPVEGWEGIIVSFPPGSQFDDYFLLAGDFAVGYGIDTSDPTLAAQLAGLCDTGTSIRVWGELTCPTINAFGTGISVNRIEVVEEPPAPVEPASGAVDGWVGTTAKLPPGSQLGGYFERDDGQRFGIGAIDEAMRKQIEEYQWTGAQLQVWGRLLTGVPDMEGRQIQVERIEAISGPASEPRNLSPFAFPSASSVLPSDRWGTYHPWSAIDGLLSSPWVEGASGPGNGEWIMLTFPGPIEVRRIGLDIGYDRDEGDTFRNKNLFSANNRVRRATIKFSNGDEIELSFSDARGVQMRDIVPVETTYVQVVIDEVYPGSRWDDTCLTEMEVWGTAK